LDRHGTIEPELGAQSLRIRRRGRRRNEKYRGIARREPNEGERDRENEPEQHDGAAKAP
jgi:hypothetical protein